MNFYTTEACQEKANNSGKPVCAWIPRPLPGGLDQLRWIIDPQGRISNYANPNPNSNETDPWEDKFSYKRLFRPERRR